MHRCDYLKGSFPPVVLGNQKSKISFTVTSPSSSSLEREHGGAFRNGRRTCLPAPAPTPVTLTCGIY